MEGDGTRPPSVGRDASDAEAPLIVVRLPLLVPYSQGYRSRSSSDGNSGNNVDRKDRIRWHMSASVSPERAVARHQLNGDQEEGEEVVKEEAVEVVAATSFRAAS